MTDVDRTWVGAAATLLFAVGLYVVGTDGLTTALAPALVGFGLLALAWDDERVLRRVGVFAGSIVAMAALLYGTLRARPGTLPRTASPQQLTPPTTGGFPDFLLAMVNFEFGFSLYYQMPVATKVAERLPYTVALLLVALVLTAAVVGILWLAARTFDRPEPAEAVAHLGSGLSPVVWLMGLVLLAVIADAGSTFFGSGSMELRGAFSAGALTSLLYPGLALALPTAGHLLRDLRAAEAGAGWSGPSAPAHWLPVSYLVGALVTIETFYMVPGLGRLWVQGVLSRDPLLSVGAAFALTAVGLFAVLVRDAALTATPAGVAPWSERHRSSPHREATGELPPLGEAVRGSRRGTLGAALLGVALVLTLYSLVAGPPTPSGFQAGPRTPGVVDLPLAVGTLVTVAGGGTVVAAVLGVPLGALLRGDDGVRTGVRDLLRTVTALPFLLLVFYLTPNLVQQGILSERWSPTAQAITIGVALVPFVALSTVDVVRTTAGGRPADSRPGPRTDGGGTTSSYIPVAIPLAGYFGYAAFLVVGLQWLAIPGGPGPRYGLAYTLRFLGDNLLAGVTAPLVVLVVAVALPVLGANLLADGLRRTLRPYRRTDRAVGWPRESRSARQATGRRSGSRPATGRRNPARERSGGSHGTSPDRRADSERGRDGQRQGGPGRDDRR